MNFRIECPKCGWGYGVKNAQINMGFLMVKCAHCGNLFWFKLTFSDIQLKVYQDLPDGCKGDGKTWVDDSGESSHDT